MTSEELAAIRAITEALAQEGRLTRDFIEVSGATTNSRLHEVESQIGLLMLRLLKQEATMSQALDAAKALAASVGPLTSKLDSMETYLQGVPALVAAAVADALGHPQVSVDDAEAARIIAAAQAEIETQVDQAFNAINANTPPEPTVGEDTTTGSGTDTTSGSTVDPTAGSDAQVGGTDTTPGTDTSLGGPDTLSGEPSTSDPEVTTTPVFPDGEPSQPQPAPGGPVDPAPSVGPDPTTTDPTPGAGETGGAVSQDV